MFGKKKNEPVENWADSKMHELYNEWSEALNVLWRKAKQTYIKAEAIKVYDLARPDGEAAKTDLDEAKYSLLCSIGRYDSAVAEIKRHYAEHHEEMNINWSMDFFTSHEQIELAIREIFKGRY